MTITLEEVHKDLVHLKKDMAIIKNLLSEDFELSDDAKTALRKRFWTNEKKQLIAIVLQWWSIGILGGLSTIGAEPFPDLSWLLLLGVAVVMFVVGFYTLNGTRRKAE